MGQQHSHTRLTAAVLHVVCLQDVMPWGWSGRCAEVKDVAREKGGNNSADRLVLVLTVIPLRLRA